MQRGWVHVISAGLCIFLFSFSLLVFCSNCETAETGS
jgi:hypothetical protein